MTKALRTAIIAFVSIAFFLNMATTAKPKAIVFYSSLTAIGIFLLLI